MSGIAYYGVKGCIYKLDNGHYRCILVTPRYRVICYGFTFMDALCKGMSRMYEV